MNPFDTYRQFAEAAKPFPTYKNAPKMPSAAELSAKAAHQSDKAHATTDAHEYKYAHSDAANAHADAALAHEHSAAKSDGAKKQYHQHMVDLHNTLKLHHSHTAWNKKPS